jgi:hypothetical protein
VRQGNEHPLEHGVKFIRIPNIVEVIEEPSHERRLKCETKIPAIFSRLDAKFCPVIQSLRRMPAVKYHPLSYIFRGLAPSSMTLDGCSEKIQTPYPEKLNTSGQKN